MLHLGVLSNSSIKVAVFLCLMDLSSKICAACGCSLI